MKDWKTSLVSPDVSIRKAIHAIDQSGIQIALVADGNGTLIGTVTDGDVRRALLKSISLDDPVSAIMNAHPTVAREQDSQASILGMMRKTTHRCIPVVDGTGRVVRIALLDKLIQPAEKNNPVVIMAGGLGARLSPLTDECPKPMIKIGAKPILETILESLCEYGFSNFFFSVNYRSEMVTDYFADGSRWGVNIQYLQETKKLGTAGALSLLPQPVNEPVIVMNGDILTRINFEQLLDFHREHRADATMCVREYDVQIPFGVVKIEEQKITSIEEKPIQRFFVNAGIYVLEPDVLKLIPADTYTDMPTVFEKLVAGRQETTVFPVREFWLDIGQLEDLERARLEYGRLFG